MKISDITPFIICGIPLLGALALIAGPTGAKSFEIVNPTEQMVVVPGLEKIGPSRISTVEHCAGIYGVEDWANMVTDSELEGMWECLLEHT